MRIASVSAVTCAPAGVATPAPAGPVDGAGPGRPAAIDLRAALWAVNQAGQFEPAWRVPFDRGVFYSSESYGGPTPIQDNQGHLYVGDSQCYRRLSPETGAAAWEVRLPDAESFRAGDPIVAGKDKELLCLPYQYETSAASSKDGFVAIDVRTGTVRFKTRGDHPITGARSDAAGNLYYGTITGFIMKVDPDGKETRLNHPQGWQPNVLDVKVRPDGVAWYSEPASRGLRRIDGLLEKEVELPGRLSYPGSTRLAPDGGLLCMTSGLHDEQVLVKVDPEGEIRWTAPVRGTYSLFTPCADGGAVVLQPGDRERSAVLARFEPDGTPGWTFTLDDPALHNGNWWSDGRMVARPNGDLVLIDPSRATILCLGPDGKERWRDLPEEFPHDAYWPCFSFSRDDQMYVVNRGGVRSLSLETGRSEMQYCRDRQFLKRREERVALAGDLPYLSGSVIPVGESLYSFDRQAGFLKLELPAVGRERLEKALREAPPEPAGEIRLEGGFVKIDGVVLPVG